MAIDPAIGRRTFLRVAGLSSGLLALSRLRLAPAALADAAPRATNATLRVLSAGDARILNAVAERMVFTGDPTMPRFGYTDALATIDTALRQLPPDTAQQLHWALRLFEYGPPVFALRLSTFTGLDAAAQDAYIAGWAESRFEIRRLAFRALKNLAMLGYYAQDATWTGIHYDGPWAPRPRRVVMSD